MKCCIRPHKFKKIGRYTRGKTLEKYVECSRCGMVVIIINVHPSYNHLYASLPKPLYFERKILAR
jgi:hypothetical protein